MTATFQGIVEMNDAYFLYIKRSVYYKGRDDGIANNEERRFLFWFNDVLGDGRIYDIL
ncbi:hypothetical protein [Paenibacillus sp. F4]|uniref:hypothetical protein n=1 Tax=Paenibacillus sp. F4 TaxID=357385 RepID=UPI0015E12FD9|nr:hypothetical protein [Paenibacillus sp. F4]